MSIQDDRPSQEPGAPVFRPGAFLGREGLVRNVVWRLKRGESLSIFGGPKLGKTSLLHHLAWQLNQGPLPTGSTRPAAVYFDLAVETDCQRLRSHSQNGDAIVLLDNCDSLVEGDNISLLDIKLTQEGASVFAGARAWKECERAGRIAKKLKPIPLAVFLEKEAEQIFGQSLSAPQKACALTYGGTHPFLLKILQAALLCGTKDIPPEQVVEELRRSLFPFFQCCVDQMRDPLEPEVLAFLIGVAKPVNPKEVALAVGMSTIKPIADTLCSLGLISRWIRDEEATLLANSRLFNEWYLETLR
jgi:hypothetical protein